MVLKRERNFYSVKSLEIWGLFVIAASLSQLIYLFNELRENASSACHDFLCSNIFQLLCSVRLNCPKVGSWGAGCWWDAERPISSGIPRCSSCDLENFESGTAPLPPPPPVSSHMEIITVLFERWWFPQVLSCDPIRLCNSVYWYPVLRMTPSTLWVGDMIPHLIFPSFLIPLSGRNNCLCVIAERFHLIVSEPQGMYLISLIDRSSISGFSVWGLVLYFKNLPKRPCYEHAFMYLDPVERVTGHIVEYSRTYCKRCMSIIAAHWPLGLSILLRGHINEWRNCWHSLQVTLILYWFGGII